MDDGWRRVADAVKARRAELDLTQEELAAAGGEDLSTPNVRVIESAGRKSYRPATIRSLCRALRWSSDSVDLIRAGEPPVIQIPVISADTAINGSGYKSDPTDSERGKPAAQTITISQADFPPEDWEILKGLVDRMRTRHES